MLEILKSERFQEEYTLYQSRINKITNQEIKSQAEVLLKRLVNEVKKLDSQHQDMFSGNQLPTALGDVKGNISTLRKKIDTMVRDWERSNSKV